MPESALNVLRRRASWAVRDRIPARRVVREVQGVTLAMPWAHRLPDYATLVPEYGQNLVDLARALAERGDFSMLDVGANIGDSAVQVLAAAEGLVLCVEADPFYLDFLHENTDRDQRVTVVEALLAVGEAESGTRAVRSGGTTHFESGGSADARPAISPASLRAENPDFDRLRLVKCDTDGFDVVLVPAIAAAWRDVAPVLFFEYDHRLSRGVGNDPLAVWPALSELGYRTVAVWDNFGTPLGRVGVDDIAGRAVVLDDAPQGAGAYWDVAVVHESDSDGLAVIEALVPDLMG